MSMMESPTIFVDTREPDIYYNYLVRRFPGINFVRSTLNKGDYASMNSLWERKTIFDLASSALSHRLDDQCEGLMKLDEVVTGYIITGRIDDYIAKLNAINKEIDSTKRQPIPVMDENRILGIISSLVCQLGGPIIMGEDAAIKKIGDVEYISEFPALDMMIKTMLKIDDEKWMVPKKRNADVLTARLFGVSYKEWMELKNTFGSINNICCTPKEELMKIHGVKGAKAARIQEVLGCQHVG